MFVTVCNSIKCLSNWCELNMKLSSLVFEDKNRDNNKLSKATHHCIQLQAVEAA